MRQVKKLLSIVGRVELVEFYNQILSYRAANNPKLPGLNEFLALASGKEQTEVKAFDENTDKLLEAEALKRLAERQKAYGK